MLRLISSNSIEDLATALASELSRHKPADPLTPQRVLISTNAMSRWLALALSERIGICAGIEFDFAGRHLRQLILELDGRLPAGQKDPWDPSQLRWQLAQCIPALPETTLWEPLRQLWQQGTGHQGNGLDAQRLHLILQLSDTLDQYGLYRPQMVRRWLKGESVDGNNAPLASQWQWQPALLRELAQRLEPSGIPHPAERLLNALEQSRQRSGPQEPLHVFGLSSLPPGLWKLLAQRASSSNAPVVLYQLSPCLDPWGSLPPSDHNDGDALARLERRLLHQGHPLLASLGRTQRDFHWQLELLAADLQEQFERQQRPAPLCPTEAGLLQQLKADLLLGRARGEGLPGVEPPLELQRSQLNLEVLACHGDRRQVEAAHEALLRLMATDPSIEPRHILVMTPDVARFTPLVLAVFERPGRSSDPRHLPVRVTDRTLRQRNPRVDLVFRLLALASSRLSRDDVLDVLLLPELAEHLELGGLTQPQWRELLDQAGICWGRDGEHRQSWGYPADDAYSWRWGLDRLLLGLELSDTFPEQEATAGEWAGLAACNQTLASAGDVLALHEACSRLFEQLQALSGPQPAERWNEQLGSAIQQLSGGDDEGWQAPEVYELLTPLRDPEASGLLLDRAAVVRLLEEAETQQQGRYGHVSGAVSLSALEPMRSIPHRVVVLLGMDEQRLPRRDQRPGYDLMLQQPWRGDRDRRQEDRAILLEALQACSDHWIATFNAIDPRSGEERNPAAPLSDLLRCLERSYRTAEGEPITAWVLQQQPPLPALTAIDAAGVPWPMDQRWPLDQKGAANLEELQQWLRDPARALLQAHGIHPHRPSGESGDPEESAPDGLQRWKLGQLLLNLGRERLEASEWPQQRDALSRRGHLPPGPAASVASERPWQRCRALLAKQTELHDADGQAVVLMSNSRFGPKRLLDGWLEHLWANAECPQQTLLLGPIEQKGQERAAVWTLPAVEAQQAKDWIDDWQQWRQEALERPIAWIPELNWQLLSWQQQDGLLPGLSAQQLKELNPPAPGDYQWPSAWLQLLGGEAPSTASWLEQPEAEQLTQRWLLPLSEALAAGGRQL